MSLGPGQHGITLLRWKIFRRKFLPHLLYRILDPLGSQGRKGEIYKSRLEGKFDAFNFWNTWGDYRANTRRTLSRCCTNVPPKILIGASLAVPILNSQLHIFHFESQRRLLSQMFQRLLRFLTQNGDQEHWTSVKTLLAIIDKYVVPIRQCAWLYQALSEVSVNKIALWINVCTDDWTAKRVIIAINACKK